MDKISKYSKVYFNKAHLEYLKSVYPRQVITPDKTMEEIQFQAGVESVIEFITANVKRQESHARES